MSQSGIWLFSAVGDPNGTRTRVFAVKGNNPLESTLRPAFHASFRALFINGLQVRGGRMRTVQWALEAGLEYAVEAANSRKVKDATFDQIMRHIAWIEEVLDAQRIEARQGGDGSGWEAPAYEYGVTWGPDELGVKVETPLESILGTIDLMEKHLAYLRHMAQRLAQGTEAQRAETVKQGSVHDGPVGEADAPKTCPGE